LDIDDSGDRKMPLFKIGDFNPNYREEAFDGADVKGLDVMPGEPMRKLAPFMTC
jgi:hypothetical protein